MNRDTFRSSIAVGCVVGAIWLHYSGNLNFAAGVSIWLFLAGGAGYMRPFLWMLAVAPIPWLVGVGGGVLTGRYDNFGEAWFAAFFVSTIAGAIGLIIGAAAGRSGGRHLYG